jgi:large subunit ribosomal protein L21
LFPAQGRDDKVIVFKFKKKKKYQRKLGHRQVCFWQHPQIIINSESITINTELGFYIATYHTNCIFVFIFAISSFVFQPNTRLRITGISGYEEYPADPILGPVAA